MDEAWQLTPMKEVQHPAGDQVLYTIQEGSKLDND